MSANNILPSFMNLRFVRQYRHSLKEADGHIGQKTTLVKILKVTE